MKVFIGVMFALTVAQAVFASENLSAIAMVKREFTTSKLYIGSNPSSKVPCTVETTKFKDGGVKLTISGGANRSKAPLSYTISPDERKSFIQGIKDFGSQSILYQTYTNSQGQEDVGLLHIHNYTHGNVIKMIDIQEQKTGGQRATCYITKIIKK